MRNRGDCQTICMKSIPFIYNFQTALLVQLKFVLLILVWFGDRPWKIIEELFSVLMVMKIQVTYFKNLLIECFNDFYGNIRGFCWTKITMQLYYFSWSVILTVGIDWFVVDCVVWRLLKGSEAFKTLLGVNLLSLEQNSFHFFKYIIYSIYLILINIDVNIYMCIYRYIYTS